MGYDNWEEFAADCRPPLTTVDLNLEQLGATAVMHLFAAVDGTPSRGVRRQPCRLVVRESTGADNARVITGSRLIGPVSGGDATVVPRRVRRSRATSSRATLLAGVPGQLRTHRTGAAERALYAPNNPPNVRWIGIEHCWRRQCESARGQHMTTLSSRWPTTSDTAGGPVTPQVPTDPPSGGVTGDAPDPGGSGRVRGWSTTTAAAPAIYILGPLEVRDRAGRTMSLPRRKQRALLALLVLRAGTTVRTDEIVEALWGERPPPSARANLHSYASGLRHVLDRAAPAISRRPSSGSLGYRLDLRQDECDAAVFERLTRSGRRELAAGRHATAAEQLTRALTLWRGTMLADLDEYEWTLPVSARLEQVRVDALESQVDARLMLGHHVEVIADLAAATARHPLRERLCGQYMVALHRVGRRAEALAVYDHLRALLRKDLGVEPDRSLRELHGRIRADKTGGATSGIVDRRGGWWPSRTRGLAGST